MNCENKRIVRAEGAEECCGNCENDENFFRNHGESKSNKNRKEETKETRKRTNRKSSGFFVKSSYD